MYHAEEVTLRWSQHVIPFFSVFLSSSLLNQFLIEAGKIFTFGDGSKGQLGHGSDLQRIKYPEQLEFFDKYRIVKAFCGECHTAFLTG